MGLGRVLGLRERQPDDVVPVGVAECAQSVRPDDDVVGRGGDGGETADPVLDVAEGTEGREVETGVHPRIVGAEGRAE